MASLRDVGLELFVAWWVLLGAMTATQEFFPYSRITILTIAGVAFVIATYVYYYYGKSKPCIPFKPVTSVQNKWKRLKMIFFVGLGFFEVVLLLPLPFFLWQFAFVDGVSVVTLLDLFLVGSFVLALYVALSLYRFFKLSVEERLDYF